MIKSKNILVLGAHGKIGRLLVDKLSNSQKFNSAAFIRNPDQVKDFKGTDVEAVVGNLEDPVDELAKEFEKYDTIIFSAGSGASTGTEKTAAVDLDGAGRAIDAAKKADISKFIMVSAAGTGNRDLWEKSGMKSYYIAKYYADEYLKHSGLNYTILRPVRLTDEAGTGKIKADEYYKGLNKEIPREDVASCIMQILSMDETNSRTIEISSGEQEIGRALESVIHGEGVLA